MLKHNLIIQRNVDVNQVNSVCDIVPLFQDVGLMNTVEGVGPYSKLLTCEFYCNLTNIVNDPTRQKCYKVFIEGNSKMSPEVINNFYVLDSNEEEEITY